jgi:hypothetical protein
MTRRWAQWGIIAALLAPHLARAAGADDKAAAQVLFEEGRKLMTQGKYADACPKLESSQRLDPGAGTLLNLAACYEANGQTASAWVTYTDAAVASREHHPDWVARAEGRAKALLPTLSHVVVEVPNAPPDVDVKRDGKVLESGSFGTAMPVDPGHHVIDATAPNKKPFHKEIDVAPKADARITVTLEDVPRATQEQPFIPIAPPPHETRSGPVRAIAITSIGVGVAGLVVGGVFGVLAIGRKNDATPNCASDFSRCNSTGKAAVDDAFTLGTVSTLGFVAGGILAVAGIVMFVLAPKHTERVGVQVSPFGIGGTF